MFQSLTWRITLASTRGNSCTKIQDPLDQAEKRVQAAFTQPVSVVFQKMSDSVKSIHCLSSTGKISTPSNASAFTKYPDLLIWSLDHTQIFARTIRSTIISTNIY